MHDRFDRIDKQLNVISEKLDKVLEKLNWQYDEIHANLENIQGELHDIRIDLGIIDRDIYSWLTDGFGQDFVKAINAALDYKENNSVIMPYQPQYTDWYEPEFYTWSVQHSTDDLRAGSSVRDYSDQRLYYELTRFPDEKLECLVPPCLPLCSNINFLSNYGYFRLGMKSRLSNNRLANPKTWSVSANAYMQLAQEWPWYAARKNIERLTNIIETGEDLEVAIKSLSDGSSGQREIFDKVIEMYRNKAVVVIDRIDEEEEQYYKDNSVLDGINIWAGGSQGSKQAGSLTTVNFGGVYGRYVRVQLNDINFLSLAEVEVMGITNEVMGITNLWC